MRCSTPGRHIAAPLRLLNCAAALLILAPAQASAQTDVHQRFGVTTPMRDGVELVSDLWLPGEDGQYPTVLVRTPYLKAKARWMTLGHAFARNGYAFIVQDARGRGDSEGEFDFFFADAEDGYDTIEWITRQSWSNGRIGMMGGSYRATVQWLAEREGAPLTCIFPQAPAARYFDEIPYTGGAFRMEWALGWINGTSGRIGQNESATLTDHDAVFAHRPLISMDSVMGRVMPLYRDFLRHSTEDAYWDRILFDDADFPGMDVPALTVTGWYDADQPGAFHYWRGMRTHSPGADRQYLLAGPWDHGETRTGGTPQIGELARPGSVMDIDGLAMEWFDWCLKGDGDGEFDLPRARVYLTGANQWMDFDEYPPREVADRSLYLHSGGNANSAIGDGTLSWDAPGEEPPDRFTFDPHHPVPSEPAGDGADQRAVQRRDDVLVYTSDVLEEPLTVLGKVFVIVHAATDARDTDFTAKLTDVYPDGRAIKLGVNPAGVIRARYRLGRDREVPIEPETPLRYEIELFDLGHTFLAGHRVRIEVSSSASPFVNPNQNTGNPVATDTEWRIAQQTVYHDRERASHVRLPVLGRR